MLKRLQEILGHTFTNVDLATGAVTHSSSSGSVRENYERLEFLGDRVLGLTVARMVYDRFPSEPEGALARRHAALVCKEALARVAGEIGLAPLITMSRGEDESGGRENPAILADVMEALIGALYLDGGIGTAEAFLLRHWPALMEEDPKPPKDAKTALQEWAQGRGKPLPNYKVQGTEGPDHAPVFTISVTVLGEAPASGKGSSKRAAEQAAAEVLLERLKRT